VKIFFFVAFFLLVMVCLSHFDVSHRSVFMWVAFSLIGACLNGSWVYQSIEKNHYYAVIVFITKSTFLSLVLFDESLTLESVAVYFSLTSVLAGLVCAFTIPYVLRIKSKFRLKANYAVLAQHVREAFSIFLYRVSVGLYPSIAAFFTFSKIGPHGVTLLDIFNKLSGVAIMF